MMGYFEKVLVISLLMAVHAKTQTGTVLPKDFYKGVNLFPLNSTILAGPEILEELKAIAALGANWVVVNFEIMQQDETSNEVFVSKSTTPSQDVLRTFIGRAHGLGLKILLKPLVVCAEGGCTFFTIKPSDPVAWFRSYGKYISSLAEFAEAEGVEALSVGLEFYRFSGAEYTNYWLEVIGAVRGLYRGYLTYCSIFWPVETQLVQFWSELDFIAMDTYVPFIKNATTDPAPTLSSMIAKFDTYFDHLHQWHSSQPANVSSLPIIITEAGYPSSKLGMAEPAQDVEACTEGTVNAANFTLQQMAWEAMFTTLTTTRTDVIEGVTIFWFDNPTSSDWIGRNPAKSKWPCSWTPRGKPAECTIATAFGGKATTMKC